jgi:ketosteroid isomerase-like protein
MDTSDFDEVIERYHIALGELTNGNPEVYKELYSRRDDVTLANPFAPFGPVSRGWPQVAETIERAATHYRDGEVLGFDAIARQVTDQLAYIVEVERFRAKVGGRDDTASIALRVTTILRREDGAWRVVHRQADTTTSARQADAVLGE